MTNRYRLGIIGCGWAGDQHARASRALDDRADLAAVADVNVEAAGALASAYGAPVVSADYGDLLDAARLEAVVIALPHALHAESVIAAAEAGLHVLVEKPLANTLAEADAMIAAAEQAGVTLMVAENVRFDPTYRQAADLIAAGRLGDLFLLRISREHQMHDYLRQRPWFLNDPGGGIMVSGGVHDYELARMLGGEIESVYGQVAPKALPEMAADDTSVAVARLAGGATAVLVESFSLRTPQPGVQGSAHGSRGSLWFYGETVRLYTAGEDGQQDRVEAITVPGENTFITEMAHFLDCIETGAAPITSGREERQPLAAVVATYESFRRGVPVRLDEVET